MDQDGQNPRPTRPRPSPARRYLPGCKTNNFYVRIDKGSMYPGRYKLYLHLLHVPVVSACQFKNYSHIPLKKLGVVFIRTFVYCPCKVKDDIVYPL